MLEEVRREVDPQLRQVLAKLQVRLGAQHRARWRAQQLVL